MNKSRRKSRSRRRSRVYSKQKMQHKTSSYRRRKTKSSRRSCKRVSKKRRVRTRVYKKPDGLSAQTPPMFKIVELEGCGYCNEAKKLIITKYGEGQLEIKKDLSLKEDNEIRKTHKNGYDYFPKIFKYNPKTRSYEFVGGFDKLKEMPEFKN